MVFHHHLKHSYCEALHFPPVSDERVEGPLSLQWLSCHLINSAGWLLSLHTLLELGERSAHSPLCPGLYAWSSTARPLWGLHEPCRWECMHWKVHPPLPPHRGSPRTMNGVISGSRCLMKNTAWLLIILLIKANTLSQTKEAYFATLF